MRKRVVISGASGLIGTALIRALRSRDYEVTRLVRRAPRSADEIEWNPGVTALNPAILDGATAVIALGGASVGRLPWTAKYRHKLLDSRLAPTNTLVGALHQLALGASGSSNSAVPPFISASAVGFYGSAPGKVLTEVDPAGATFLAQLCTAWEDAALAAADVTDVALLRTAPVIDPNGVLKPMMLLTKLGLAGPLGSGKQHLPWISLADEVGAIMHVLEKRLTGPINLTGPKPATANELGRALATEMRRPFWLPTPAWILRAALSKQAADSLLLADAQVVPDALIKAGYKFEHQTVTAAVRAALAH